MPVWDEHTSRGLYSSWFETLMFIEEWADIMKFLDQGFLTCGTHACQMWCFEQCLLALEHIKPKKKKKKYIEKRVYLPLQYASYCLSVVQHQNIVRTPVLDAHSLW